MSVCFIGPLIFTGPWCTTRLQYSKNNIIEWKNIMGERKHQHYNATICVDRIQVSVYCHYGYVNSLKN